MSARVRFFMKNPLVFALFLSIFTVACGSSPDQALSNVPTSSQSAPISASEPTPTPSATISASDQVNTGTQPSTVASPSPTPSVSPSEAPESAPTPTPVPTPSVAPTNAPDAYQGTYETVTLPLYKDACAGSCSPTIAVPQIVVSHSAQGYQVNGIDANAQPGGLTWSVTQPGVISTCSNVLSTVGGELSIAQDGRYVETYGTLNTGTCNGGVRSNCGCTYIDYVAAPQS